MPGRQPPPPFEWTAVAGTGHHYILVELQRNFIYHQKQGMYAWHKAWRLPVMRVNAFMAAAAGAQGAQGEAPRRAAGMLELKAVKRTDAEIPFEDVGLQGETLAELRASSTSAASFSQLMFSSTSFKHRGAPFHLLISLFGADGALLCAVLSPPIHVNSRKQDEGLGGVTDPIRPFDPINLTRRLVKIGRVQGVKTDINIDSSLDGMVHYLTAPNIKGKVRHAVFLAVRFCDAIGILQNVKAVDAHASRPPVGEGFASMLRALAAAPPTPGEAPQVDKEGKEDAPYVLCIRPVTAATLSAQALDKLIDLIRGPANMGVKLAVDFRALPDQYAWIDDVETLATRYKAFYRSGGNVAEAEAAEQDDAAADGITERSTKRTRTSGRSVGSGVGAVGSRVTSPDADESMLDDDGCGGHSKTARDAMSITEQLIESLYDTGSASGESRRGNPGAAENAAASGVRPGGLESLASTNVMYSKRVDTRQVSSVSGAAALAVAREDAMALIDGLENVRRSITLHVMPSTMVLDSGDESEGRVSIVAYVTLAGLHSGPIAFDAEVLQPIFKPIKIVFGVTIAVLGGKIEEMEMRFEKAGLISQYDANDAAQRLSRETLQGMAEQMAKRGRVQQLLALTKAVLNHRTSDDGATPSESPDAQE